MTEITLDKLISGNYSPATREQLTDLGFRYFQTDEFEKDGRMMKMEIMAYQDAEIIFVYKRSNPDGLFKFHTKAKIEERVVN